MHRLRVTGATCQTRGIPLRPLRNTEAAVGLGPFRVSCTTLPPVPAPLCGAARLIFRLVAYRVADPAQPNLMSFELGEEISKMASSVRLLFPVLLSLMARQCVGVESLEFGSSRMRASGPRTHSFRDGKILLRAVQDYRSPNQFPSLRECAHTRLSSSCLQTRLRGGMALSSFFQSSKISKDEGSEPQDEIKKSVDDVPIKWVVAGTVGGLCLLSSQIANALVLAYGVSYPAYCR